MCFLFRRESPWKVDGESTGVSAKLKLLEQELSNFERIGKSDLSKVPSLMRKQAKRYQALAGKIDDLCQRMVVCILLASTYLYIVHFWYEPGPLATVFSCYNIGEILLAMKNRR